MKIISKSENINGISMKENNQRGGVMALGVMARRNNQ
jgi:hypothetical protein